MRTVFNPSNSLVLFVVLLMAGSFYPVDAAERFNQDLYLRYVQEGVAAYQNNEMDKAISAFEKALPLTYSYPRPPLYNNIAVAYIGRSNSYYDQGNFSAALSDGRMAYYYAHYFIHYGTGLFPRSLSALHARNDSIAEDNLKLLYKALKVAPNNAEFHLTEARMLEKKGEKTQALVEYTQAASLGLTEAFTYGQRLAQNLGFSEIFKTEVYLKSFSRTLKSLWFPKRKDKPYVVVVSFNIQHDGEITDAAIKTSSQDAEADQKALKAVTDAIRLDAPPEFLLSKDKKYVSIEFIFDYEIKNKSKN